MTESHTVPGNSHSPTDRLERLLGLLLFLLFLLIFQGLRRPAGAYPLSGLAVGLGLDAGAIIALVLVAVNLPRSAKCQWAVLLSLVLFALWTELSLYWSPLRSKGQMTVMGLLFGYWAFVVGFVLARFSPCRMSASVKSGIVRLISNPLGAPAIYVTLLVLIFSLHAFYQFFYGFEARLRELAAAGIYQGNDPISGGIRFALRQRRVFSVFGNPNHFACFLALGLPFALALVMMKAPRWLNVLGCATLALGLEAAILTASRGGLVSVAVGLAVALALIGKTALSEGRRRLAASALIFVMVAGIVGSIQFRSRPQNASEPLAAQRVGSQESDKTSLLERLSSQSTVRERIYYLQTAWELFRRAPVAGNGAGAYGTLYPQARQPGAQESQYAHNFVAQVAVEQGLVGLGLLVAALAIAIHCMILSWRDACSKNDGICRLLTMAPIAGSAAFLVNGLVDFGFYVANLFALFGLILGMGVGSLQSSPPQLKSPGRLAIRCILVVSIGFLPGLPWMVPYSLSRHYEQQARDAYDSRDPGQAALNYEKALHFQPHDPYLLHALAATYRILGDSAEAVRLLRKAVDLFDDSALIHNELSLAYLDLGHDKAALDEMRTSVERYPLEPRYRMNLAVLLLRLGHKEEALQAARDGVRLARDRAPEYSEFLESLEQETTPTLRFF
ncbi:MAG: O-antigen ligase family protein [bacterium]